MRKGLISAILAAVAGLAMPAGAATILQNGSFETGVPGNVLGSLNGASYGAIAGTTGASWDRWSSLNGWSVIGGAGAVVETDRTDTRIDAQNGEYYLALDRLGNTRIAQTVALSVGRYTLSLWYSPDQGSPATNGISFGLTGLQTGTATIGTSLARRGVWTLISLDVLVKTAGNYQVYVGATGPSDNKGGFVDNIALTPVPVPAAGAALLGALGLLAGLRRRKTPAAA